MNKAVVKKIIKRTMEKTSKIYVAGHQGLVGSAILKDLQKKGFTNIITRSHRELDLSDCNRVDDFLKEEKPEFVFLAAAKVGGIVANNTYRADFLYQNLMIQNNVIHYSYVHGVKKLMFLGSTCIYPKNSPQPIKEEYLLSGPLEYTNEPYAVAKIAGIKMCESYNLQYGTNFISVMPTNLYGPKDNFDLEKSHVLPALLRKAHLGKAIEENDWEAIAEDLNRRPIDNIDGSHSKEEILSTLKKYGIVLKNSLSGAGNKVSIEIWGSGQPYREFLWSEEMADACVFLMEKRDFWDIISVNKEQNGSEEIRNTHINIGSGREISIAHLAEIVKVIVRYEGDLSFNTARPDGAPRKLTDVSKLNALGWHHKIDLDEGIFRLYNWYRSSIYNRVGIKD